MTPTDLNIGRVFGDFRVDSLIGEGGLGTVYLGTQLSLRRRVAIKLIKSDLVDRRVLRQRFLREAKSLAQLDHPNIVRILHFAETDDTNYLVLEYVPGHTLAHIIKRRAPIEPKHAVRIARRIAQALINAHAKGIIHRDIKPGNVMVLGDGKIKVLDFGLAKIAGDMTTTPTREGAQIGTPLYMSPEQWRGDPLTAQADIYSLGAMLYEMLTGEPPFRGKTFAAIMSQALTEDVPDPGRRNHRVNNQLSEIVRDMTARDPRKRYVSAEAVERDLTAWLQAEKRRASAGRDRIADTADLPEMDVGTDPLGDLLDLTGPPFSNPDREARTQPTMSSPPVDDGGGDALDAAAFLTFIAVIVFIAMILAFVFVAN